MGELSTSKGIIAVPGQEGNNMHRHWHTWLKRFRRFINDDQGRGSMRLTEKRKNEGFVNHNKGLLFLLCVFVAFMQAGLFTGHSAHQSVEVYPDAEDAKWGSNPFDTTAAARGLALDHPIPKLMADAEENFRKLLARQSRKLHAAVKEYKRRYGREPPKGFDGWWRFAQDNNVKMVDEFDGLMEDLAPFWEISGEELRRRALQVSCIRL